MSVRKKYNIKRLLIILVLIGCSLLFAKRAACKTVNNKATLLVNTKFKFPSIINVIGKSIIIKIIGCRKLIGKIRLS